MLLVRSLSFFFSNFCSFVWDEVFVVVVVFPPSLKFLGVSLPLHCFELLWWCALVWMFFYSLSWYSLNPLLEAYALQFWEIFLEIVFYNFFLICLSSHFLRLLCCILNLPDLPSNFLSFSLSLDIFLLFGSLSGKFSWLDLPTFEMKFLFWLSFLIFKHSFFFFNPFLKKLIFYSWLQCSLFIYYFTMDIIVVS